MGDSRDLLTAIFSYALAAADPYEAVARHGEELLSRYEKGGYTRFYVLAFGKAVAPMLRAVTDRMGGQLTGVIAITKHGYLVECKSDRIAVYEAGHPLPDEAGLRATREAMELARTFDEKTFLVCLISGGGSALLVAPYTGISLAEKQKTTDLLLKAGADITDLNAVRKHASMVKGGRLAEIAYPATIESMILSDVMGDPLDVIASGPTAPDSTTYADALNVIEKFGLRGKVPPSLLHLLQEGSAGRFPETPKEGNPVFRNVRNTIVANNGAAIEAGQRKAGELGFQTVVLSTQVSGEAAQMGRWLAAQARAARAHAGRRPGAGKRLCLISGGETTVTVKGHGLGGRNMELALAFAVEIEGEEGIALISAGTDGSDGPTDAAGAIVDGATAGRARSAGIDPEKYLADNDSYHFFEKAGGLFRTGPTGTNVMDVQIMLVG
jgi:hydroxypyruvate reductase/glycerate 2-kinase